MKSLKDWKKKHAELAEALEDEFVVPFRDNGNSFESCFQFEATLARDNLRIRVKYYWKSLV